MINSYDPCFLMYPAWVEYDEDHKDFVITFRDLPGVISGGKDSNECLLNGADTLESHLCLAMNEKRGIRRPSQPLAWETMIPVRFETAIKLIEYWRKNG